MGIAKYKESIKPTKRYWDYGIMEGKYIRVGRLFGAIWGGE